MTGIAWYRPEQWQRLREVSADKEDLEETHTEWLVTAHKSLNDLQRLGVSLVKVDVDVEELVPWCQRRHLPVDAHARAQFVTYKLQQTAGLQPMPSKAN